ncbi:hypothetical protein XA68_13695 [Ophiocordyceps unilateralis]|uniref:HRDC domain-containing protein n=1 Tax=Ophiocordyceps unilateralis TaxID=268505 RepID=A0A2A9PAH9_OPHUN|nr:hypothetical protein XA68_13695 [Ophiocordyceps unilateralis]
MDAPRDFESQQKEIQKSLVSTVKTVNRLAAEDLPFLRTVNPETARQLDDSASRALGLSTRLLQAAARACKTKTPKLQDVEDIDIKWQSIVDVVDSVLEKADTALDEFTGLIKPKEPSRVEQMTSAKKSKSPVKVIRNAAVSKPQALFEQKPDNFPSQPWKPLLTTKPHATVPLADSLVTFTGEDGALQYKHPYEAEITDMQYPDRLFHVAEPIPPQPVESTSATWVDTYEGVVSMLQELKKANEIAVDLEHHDFRTYTGLVCLMQISTREKDWIVDTLQPWRHKLEVLNEVFADPKIVKVFHGAYMDVVWLQRDLGLYVNCLFDTFFASTLLNYPSRSLAFLLSKLVNFDADKQYQLADWRIRPIPPEMLYYARSDTHYLLYIYDRLRNELVTGSDRGNPDTDLIGGALQRSRELCLSRHEHPEFDKETGRGSRGWYGYVLKQAHLGFDSEQFAVFRALWQWRDAVAREQDESPNFVLGTHQMVSIVRVNPPDVKALHSMLPYTAPLARARFTELWNRVRQAKGQGGPSMLQFFETLTSDAAAKPPARAATVAKTSIRSEHEGNVGAKCLTRSSLFGDMAISARLETGSSEPKGPDNPLPFPWQRFVQGLAGGDDDGDDEKASKEAQDGSGDTTVEVAPARVDAAAEVAADEEFTLKRGRKRKSEALEDKGESSVEDEAASGDADEVDDGDGVIRLSEDGSLPGKVSKRAAKRQRRKEGELQGRSPATKQYGKKAQKREERSGRKAKKKQERKQAVQQAEETAFDYSKAASVLHAGKGAAQEATKKVFDPYGKTADEGLKGARKAPPVRGEKSATFKR